ncbi:nuclear transport factor 2 family protein [Rhodococcus sp. NPDC019627]|uniref:nuclear transport factor 2 family protein n=1 Tax=unclassified Rhodococcus (in: high G+C Gram-positive bacteria) TaxID=192944 RepID=UPI0033FBE8A2
MTDLQPKAQSMLDRLTAENNVRRVLADYCHGVDRKNWDLVRQCYHDDATDSHGAFNGTVPDLLQWMRDSHQHVSSSFHVLTNVRVMLTDDLQTAHTESYCMSFKEVSPGGFDAYATSATSLSRSARRTVACRYVDHFEDRPGVGWRITSRVVAIDWIRRDDGEMFLPIDPSWTRSQRDRSDAFYAEVPAKEQVKR